MRLPAVQSLFRIALHSYVAELRDWLVSMVTGYALASGFILAGATSLLLAFSVGVAAAFHVIAMQHGILIAYGATGGFFLVLGLSGLMGGRLLMKRTVAPVPRPRREIDMVKRPIAALFAARAVSNSRPGEKSRTHPVTQALAVAAAVTLAGWIVAARFEHQSGVDRE